MYSNIFVVLLICVYSGYSKDLQLSTETYLGLLVFVLFIQEVYGQTITRTSYIKPCTISAPDFDDCCLQEARKVIPILVKGDKRYNVPVLAPLVLPSIALDSDEQFSLALKDVSIYGLETTDLKDLKIDTKNHKVHARGIIDKIIIIGNYSIDGQILVLPLKGVGDINVTGVALEFWYDLNYTLKPINGVDYLVTQQAKVDFKVDNAFFSLTNLFNGNKQLGDETNRLINEEPLKFLDAIKPVITETISKVATGLVTNIVSEVPYEKILLK